MKPTQPITPKPRPRPKLPHFVLARRRWLSLGIGIKRWLILLALGSGLVGMGIVYAIIWARRLGLLRSTTLYRILTLQWMPVWAAMLVPLVIGALFVLVALISLGRNILAPFRNPDIPIAEEIYEHTRREKGAHIVAIGGGTGLSALLRGLRHHTRNITAVVTVADDGGSSGRLRRELGILPPGDLRNNMAALARDEGLMSQLLQYRFGSPATNKDSSLRGHSFGNLLLAALVGLTGSFEEALLAAQRVLAIRGEVIPATLNTVDLAAEVEIDGQLVRVEGESAIPEAGGRIRRVHLTSANRIHAYPRAIQAILNADLVVLGPGSLYTSILPNLLVPTMAEALCHTNALKVYVCNVATQPGETDQFTVADHVAALTNHIGADCVDVVLANQKMSFELPAEANSQFVAPIPPDGVKMVTAALTDDERPWRHDSHKLAQTLLQLLP